MGCLSWVFIYIARKEVKYSSRMEETVTLPAVHRITVGASPLPRGRCTLDDHIARNRPTRADALRLLIDRPSINGCLIPNDITLIDHPASHA